MSSDEPSFLYVVCYKHFYKPAENHTDSREFPKIMAKNAHADTLGVAPFVCPDR